MGAETEEMKVNRILWSPRVPYSERTKVTIREMVMEALSTFRNLHAHADDYTHNNGITSYLMQLKGTVPVPFRGNTYNIPVVIWLPDDFPRCPPFTYVTPTAKMRIAEDHAIMNANGEVFAPITRMWERRGTAVREMIQQMIEAFSLQPPVYAVDPAAQQGRHSTASPRPHENGSTHQVNPAAAHRHPVYAPGPSAGPSPAQHPTYGTTPHHQPHRVPPPPASPLPAGSPVPMYGGVAQGVPVPQARAAPAPALGPAGHAAGGVSRGDPPQPPGQRQQQAKGRPAASGPAAAEFAGMARAYLSERVRGCVAAAVDATKAELEVENGTYAELKEEARAMDAEVQSLVSERVAVDQAARYLNEVAVQMEDWLKRNEGVASGSGVDAGNLFQPVTAEDGKLLALHAEDAAIDDALEVVDELLQKGAVSTDTYIRKVRQLSKRQFLVREAASVLRGSVSRPGGALPTI